MTVSVHIVTWNHRQYLGPLFDSLRQQTYPIERILVVDNASTDGSADDLNREPNIHFLRFTRNTGFSHAHNHAITITKTDAILVTNPDLLLEPTCLEELVKALEADPAVGSACPRLQKFTVSADDLREPTRSGTIDAAGLILRRSRQALNRGEGTTGQYDQPEDVFGAPGVLALYRRTALLDVAVAGEIFDEDFFAYKEDVDLAWRLQNAGWRCRYVPAALAYHHRTLAHHGDSVRTALHLRRTRSPSLRTLSYRNHFLTLFKNERAGTLLPHLPLILWYELKKITYLLFREPQTLFGLGQALRLYPKMSRKRTQLAEKRRITSVQFRRQLSP